MNNVEIMDYLYGEMEDEQRKEFESRVENDKALREELQSLEQVRLFLHKSEDQEPVVKKTRTAKLSIFRSRWFAIAASLLVLLVAGKLLDLRMMVSNQQFVVQFGDEIPVIPPDDVEKYDQILAALQSLQTKVDQKADLSLVRNQLDSENSLSEGDLVKAFKQSLQDQNRNLSREVSDRVQLEQRAYVQDVVTDLIQYWDAQREEDLRLLNNGLENLAQAIQLNDPAQLVSVENL